MHSEPQTYRSFLKAALADRARARSGYSIRAFAEKAGISNSFLSEVLNGKKSLSVELAFKIAVKLQLTDLETQYFCLQVQLDQEKDPAFREELSRRLNNLDPSRRQHDLSADLFKVVADWHHFAILELTHVAGFRGDPAWIAKRLGIPRMEVEIALDRLLRLELLEETNRGLRKTHGYVLAQSAIPNGAMKEFHRQVLAKTEAALVSQKPKERISATDFIPLDSRQLPEVDRLSQEFSTAVVKLSGKALTKDHVYGLSVHCIRLTEKEGNS